MTPESCAREDLRIALGALALDALDADEAREVRRHMADCPDCQAEYASFVGVRSVLDAGLVLAPARVEQPAARTPTARTPTGRAKPWRRPSAGVPGRSRLAQLGAIGGAAGLVVAAFFVGASTTGSPTAEPSPSAIVSTAPRHDLPPVTNAEGVIAAVSYRPTAWGTWVGIRMSNVPVGYTCKLVAYGKDGTVAPVSSWNASPGQSSVTVNGSISMAASAIDHFEVEVNAKDYDITIPMTS
jgi:hypothetical protein